MNATLKAIRDKAVTTTSLLVFGFFGTLPITISLYGIGAGITHMIRLPGLVAAEREAWQPVSNYGAYRTAMKACREELKNYPSGFYCDHMDWATAYTPNGEMISQYSDHLKATAGLFFHKYEHLGTVYISHDDTLVYLDHPQWSATHEK